MEYLNNLLVLLNETRPITGPYKTAYSYLSDSQIKDNDNDHRKNKHAKTRKILTRKQKYMINKTKASPENSKRVIKGTKIRHWKQTYTRKNMK